MDPVERNLETYLTSNLAKLPKDVLHALLSSLDPASLLALCTGNQELKKACSLGKAASGLDLAAARYISENAPLAKPIRSLADQANLIKRGFCTTYNCFVSISRDPEQYDVSEVEFGVILESQMMNFSIKGMPPSKGTKVWITGQLDTYGFVNQSSSNRYSVEIAKVYRTQEEAILSIFGNDDFPERKDYENKLRNREVIDDQGGDFSDYFALEVVLPRFLAPNGA